MGRSCWLDKIKVWIGAITWNSGVCGTSSIWCAGVDSIWVSRISTSGGRSGNRRRSEWWWINSKILISCSCCSSGWYISSVCVINSSNWCICRSICSWCICRSICSSWRNCWRITSINSCSSSWCSSWRGNTLCCRRSSIISAHYDCLIHNCIAWLWGCCCTSSRGSYCCCSFSSIEWSYDWSCCCSCGICAYSCWCCLPLFLNVTTCSCITDSPKHTQTKQQS